MAKITGLKLKIAGVNAVLRSAAVQRDLDRRGRAMAARAGEGFEYRPSPHKWTSRGYVETRTNAARRREADEKVLVASLNAGRT